VADYDVLIIGSGSAGQTVAAECAKAGSRVAVVDRLPFGGTCALRGCEPKKVLLAAAEALSRTSGLQGEGVTGPCRINWPALMERKRRYTDPVPARTLAWMRDMGIATLSGAARFRSADTVEVAGDSIRASVVVIATGARPVSLGIEGEDAVLTSTDFLSLEQMPHEVAFIGGGFIAFEFARLAQLAGAKVAILHRSARVLKGFDPSLADALAERYRELGIDVRVDAPVERIDALAGGRLSVATPSGKVEVDKVFHAAGRVADLEDLDLRAAGVEYTRRGVTVDAFLRSTSNPIVWSAGDACGAGAPLTPVAGAQGQVVAAGILGNPTRFDDSVTPSVVFSDPPLARVGMAVEAAEKDERLDVSEFDMSGWFTQTRVGNTAAGARIVVDRGSGAIRGAHLLGVEADEVINIFATAIRGGQTLADLRTMTWTYPTGAYDINYLSGRW
jgi:glutathione reductase (NADPH)